MNFTDIFVKKPVLATVVSLLILVIGLRAALSLPVRQYPRTENAVVTVTTAYYGADPDVVAGFITQPLENAIAQANGIDYITSTSTNSLSTITVNLRAPSTPFDESQRFTLECGPQEATERLQRLAELGFDDALLMRPNYSDADLPEADLTQIRALLPRS